MRYAHRLTIITSLDNRYAGGSKNRVILGLKLLDLPANVSALGYLILPWEVMLIGGWQLYCTCDIGDALP